MKWIRVYRCGFCRETFDMHAFETDDEAFNTAGVYSQAFSPANFAMHQGDHRPLRFHKCDLNDRYRERYGFGDFVGVREVCLGDFGVGVAESPEVRAIADALSGGPTRDVEAKSAKAPSSCSFCGKHLKEVTKLIVGAWVCICDECVGLCVDIIAKEAAEKDKAE